MDLGEGIRKALAKITGAAIVDGAAIKALVKELQRVLISNDVNVQLVFELTKRIEAKALKEKKSESLNLREHIVKTVYDELVAILGEKYEPQVKKQKILVLGLFGSGKCVTGDSRIAFSDGKNTTIREIYDSATEPEEQTSGGFIRQLKEPIKLPAMNQKTLKIEDSDVSVLWKLKKTAPLRTIYLDNGNNHKITTTSEHPFFVLKNGSILQLRSDELSVGDQVAVPSSIPVSYKEFDLKRTFFEKTDGNLLIFDMDLAKKAKQEIKNKKETLKSLHSNSKAISNYANLSHALKMGFVPMWLIRALFSEKSLNGRVKVKLLAAKDFIEFPLTPSEDFAEFLGYFIADGSMDKSGIQIVNEEPALVERSKQLFRSLFSINPHLLKDKRSKNLFRITGSSTTLTSIFNSLFGFPLGKKSSTVRIPNLIMQGKVPEKSVFLRAYFDCDGSAALSARGIEFVTASEKLSGDLRILLLHLNLFPSLSKKIANKTPYYRISLRSNSVNRFATAIFSLVPKKQKRLLESIEIAKTQGLGQHENIRVGRTLQKVREKYGASIGEMQNYVSSYGTYESEGMISKNSLKKFVEALPKIKNNRIEFLKKVRGEETYAHLEAQYKNRGWLNATISHLFRKGFVALGVNSPLKITLTPKGHQKILEAQTTSIDHEETLKTLCFSDLNWLKVKRITLEELEEWVYDLTVEKHRNFIANEMIVHNTTSIAKLAKFYQSKGLKVCVIAGDVHRPAALEQLQQLSTQVHCGFFGEKGKTAAQLAKDSLKLESQYDVLIFDSAGRSAFDKELEKELKEINSIFAPDEKFLVVSADLGQVAGKQAQQFSGAVGITGVIVTKMDGSGKGGGALSAVNASNSKVAFITLGEKPDALEVFDAKKFVARLVGFADLPALLEKVQEMSDEEAMKKVLEDGTLDYETFLVQLRSMRKMGPLKQIMQMLGMYDVPEEMLGQSEKKLKLFEAAVLSMTKKERLEPDLMKNKSRQDRVAKGAGLKPEDVRELVTNFEKMHKMMKGMKGNRGLMKRFSNMLPPGLKM